MHLLVTIQSKTHGKIKHRHFKLEILSQRFSALKRLGCARACTQAEKLRSRSIFSRSCVQNTSSAAQFCAHWNILFYKDTCACALFWAIFSIFVKRIPKKCLEWCYLEGLFSLRIGKYGSILSAKMNANLRTRLVILSGLVLNENLSEMSVRSLNLCRQPK